jgi:hypothetical protein
MRNPTVKRKIDRALSAAQQAMSELTVYGGNEADRTFADEMWGQIEAWRHRLGSKR